MHYNEFHLLKPVGLCVVICGEQPQLKEKQVNKRRVGPSFMPRRLSDDVGPEAA